MIELKLHKFDLPLKHTFTIARGSRDVQPTLIVELTDGNLRGFGEATTSPYYNATYESMTVALESVREDVRDWSVDDPAKLHELLAPKLAQHPFAQCALDEAACDLWGKRQGLRSTSCGDSTPPTTPFPTSRSASTTWT